VTMKLELTPEVQAGLLARAQEGGLSLEAFAERVLSERARGALPAGSVAETEPFWKSFTRQVHALPDAVFERLPEDGASEHDHYLYGEPKKKKNA
jgi:hypothetical protein